MKYSKKTVSTAEYKRKKYNTFMMIKAIENQIKALKSYAK